MSINGLLESMTETTKTVEGDQDGCQRRRHGHLHDGCSTNTAWRGWGCEGTGWVAAQETGVPERKRVSPRTWEGREEGSPTYGRRLRNGGGGGWTNVRVSGLGRAFLLWLSRAPQTLPR